MLARFVERALRQNFTPDKLKACTWQQQIKRELTHKKYVALDIPCYKQTDSEYCNLELRQNCFLLVSKTSLPVHHSCSHFVASGQEDSNPSGDGHGSQTSLSVAILILTRNLNLNHGVAGRRHNPDSSSAVEDEYNPDPRARQDPPMMSPATFLLPIPRLFPNTLLVWP
jgi:hypothetical protein